MSRRCVSRESNLAALGKVALAILVVALFVAVFPIDPRGHAGGVAAPPLGSPGSNVAGRGTGPSAGLGGQFPAPLGGPDPTLPTAATPAVQQLLQHRTEVASLVAHRGVGYAYSTGVAWLAYAPWDQAFYVAAPPSSVDEILAGSTSVTAVIAVGTDPFGVAVDNATDQVWVTNTGSNNVTVINGTTQAVIANIAVPSEPLGIAVNPTQGRVFVADNGTNQTSVINANSDSVLANVTVGTEPVGVVFDGATDRAFVSDFGSSEVTVLNGLTGQGLGNVSVGSEPIGLAVDNATDAVYVANEGSQNVSVITAGSGTVNATVPIPTEGYDSSLQGVAYDSAHHLIWVTAGFTAAVINTSEERAVDEIVYDPAGIAYDPANGDVCLTNSANVTFGCFTFGSGLQADANVTFSETGLPPGTPWNVTLSPGPLTYGLGSSIRQTIAGASFVIGVDVWRNAPGYNYSFSIQPAAGEVPNPLRGYVWSSGGSPSFVNVTFTGGGVYLVQFNESGLSSPALRAGWAVTLGGFQTTSTGATIGYWETNGTYPFSTSGPWNWTSSPSVGNVTVAGRSVNVTVDWSFASGGNGVLYTVSLQESGLPNGTRWLVNLNNSTWGSGGHLSAPSGWSAQVFQGTYEYTTGAPVGWSSTNWKGVVVVTNASVTVDVAWVWEGSFPVTFTETGLPNGTLWGVYIGNTSNWSGAPSIVLDESNGSYAYSVAPVDGYRILVASGVVSVGGSAPPAVNVTFVSTDLYSVTFEETGLPGGTGWAVSIGAQLNSSLGPNVSLFETNGSFGYLVLPVAGFTTTDSGFVVVAGANRTVAVDFVVQTFPVIVVEFGLPNGTLWSVQVTNASTGFNATFSTNGNTLVFDLPNGTYTLSVRAGGYGANLSTPTFTIAGKLLGSSPTVRFSAPGGPGGGAAPAEFSAALVGAAVGAAVLGGVALGVFGAAWRRRSVRREGIAWLGELTDSESDLEPIHRP